MSALDAFDIRKGDVVAVVGAGGKTTLVHALAREARSRGWRVLLTTTTHTGRLPARSTGPVVMADAGDVLLAVRRALEREGFATLLGSRVRDDKLRGLDPEAVDRLADEADLVLVEADGARGRSLKLPAPHEPVLPGRTTLMVVIAALDVLGAPVEAMRVHRLELVQAALGELASMPLDERGLARVLVHPSGYVSRLPSGARGSVFLNKAEWPHDLAVARRVAELVAGRWARVVAGSARAHVCRVDVVAPSALPES